MAVLITGAALTGYEINTIRIGGPLAASNQRISDLQADILPPPAYIIEPFLEATLLVEQPATLPDRQAALTRLERDFRASIAKWKASELQGGLKSMLIDKAARNADDFWGELDNVTLPAIRRGDRAAAQASYARLSDLYAAHRRDIDALVKAAGEAQARVTEESLATLRMTIAILAVLGLIVAGMLGGGLFYLIRLCVLAKPNLYHNPNCLLGCIGF